MTRQLLNLGKYLQAKDLIIQDWNESDFLRRLWAKDFTLWSSEEVPEINNRLGWLILPELMQKQSNELLKFAESVVDAGIQHIVLLGMGGSSLAPAVFQETFGNAPGFPQLIVMDSTHPDQIAALEESIELKNTIFIVASKSGTTLETISLFHYFWMKVKMMSDKLNETETQSVHEPGSHFIAISDQGTPLMKLAQESNFRKIFPAHSDLGGRYSALTMFGMVPAALIGVDIVKILDNALVAQKACTTAQSCRQNPGLELGATLAALNKKGIDKLTFIASPTIGSFPKWLEQLIAESTGKNGMGIVPIAEEPFVPIESYGCDRLFVFIILDGDDNSELMRLKEQVEAAGYPRIILELNETNELGMEIYKWEIAVVSASASLKIHPFNQPDVELTKKISKKLITTGREIGLADGLKEEVSIDKTDKLKQALNLWLKQAVKGDYIAIQAFLPPNETTTAALQRIREKLLRKTTHATTLGYGPQFLHSTGQLHKGGPTTGLFLQIVNEPEREIAVPTQNYTFKEMIHAQALGDYQALKQRNRQVLRINLNKTMVEGLNILLDLIPYND